ncbi:hypothetical protein [Cohnella soli]|uniref:Uncharacterized protein n=1 Tax=Cohnella soli TaxID=425005 RepID=A0ABW0HRG3_9BACL
MTKLDANNRWGPKFLLDAHQVKYEQRDKEKQIAGATSEEMQLIRESILLPELQKMLQQSIEEVGNSNITLHKTMAVLMQLLLDSVSRTKYGVNREMKRKNIKVTKQELIDNITTSQYLCRGLTGSFGMTREVMREQIGLHLKRAINDVLRPPNMETKSPGR